MKRSGPLRRRTRLKAGKPLPRRRKRVRRRSRPSNGIVDDLGTCMFPGCPRPAANRHHRKTRARGGSDRPENLINLCRPHHMWVHDNPRLGHQLGLLRHSWEAE